ncbi:hypothetical protein GOP47_0014677 [Adiantum capillus-veneris]|uniref:Filament-like plant protein 4 n=1 Tax=Adiantum capillus-veneris TaxID=13818 RepID=A0A9D4UMH0_ADICA|nr:hypothetical protein GOP47_0014677 [Adiantum capillus-veneris]
MGDRGLDQQLFFQTQETLVPTVVEDHRLTEAISLREQAEANLKVLKEELSNALKDAASKEATAKQHEKVMEEAVLGWEKAEKEALSYKQELEAASKQKTILEDRNAHLDGALKECMKQVRHVKEEQEKKIDETILTKTREWEKIKAEVDAKQVELERRLMESEAQNSAMAKSLQERAKKILDANEVKERAETQGRVLQVKVSSLEKEISALKYELHVLNKELEIRNEEVECNKKAADAAHKQHLDNVKKVAKLEADCQRLRNLVRKKLPGPAAIAQMRREVEGPSSRENGAGEMKRRPSKSLTNGSMSFSSSYQSEVSTSSRDVELLKDRMSSMEEETKLLKEALSKRNEELHASRMLCAKTANKLSIAEDHIESLQGTPKETRTNVFDVNTNTEPSITSASEEVTSASNVEEASRAESWASALISELALFKKGKPVLEEVKEPTDSSQANDSPASKQEIAASQGVNQSDNSSSESAMTDSCFQELDLLCKELDCKFSSIEDQVWSMKSENGDYDKQVTETLMSSFDTAHQKFAQLEKVIQGIGEARRSCGSMLPSSPATMAISEDLSLVNPIPVSTLRSVLSELIVLLEALFLRCKQKPETSLSVDADSPSEQENGSSKDTTLAPAWNEQKQALITSKDSFLEGKSAVSEFLIRFGIILCEVCDLESAELEELLGSVSAVSSPQLADVSPAGFMSEIALVRDQLQQMGDAKAELELQIASISEELGGTKIELGESKDLVINLQSKVAGLHAIEKNLSEVEAIKVELQGKLREAEGEVNKLQTSIASLTLELAEEKKVHGLAAVKCEELECQLRGRLIYEDECNGKVPDDEDTRLGKERELVAAKEKLSECQRTIHALGKQLSALSSPPTELSPGGSFDTVSMDSASLIEQRMQMELQNGAGSMEHHANSHQNYHHQSYNGDGRYNGELTLSPRAPMVATGNYHSGRRIRMLTPPPPPPPPPAMQIHSGWNSAGNGRMRTRAYNEEMLEQTPRGWAGHSNGSYTKGARHQNGGPPPETEHAPHHHHHTYQQPAQRRPAYVSPSCQYSQRSYEGGGPTWAPGYLPEEEEGQLALTVYSPPHTAMSSPARSPARYVQQQLGAGRASGRTAIRTSLTESMNAAASESNNFFTESKAPSNSKPSALGKLFSRTKNHR